MCARKKNLNERGEKEVRWREWQREVGRDTDKSAKVVGRVGFIMSSVALLLGWMDILGWILWALGAFFSVLGMFRNNRGLAIAGIIISIVAFLVIFFIYGAFDYSVADRG